MKIFSIKFMAITAVIASLFAVSCKKDTKKTNVDPIVNPKVDPKLELVNKPYIKDPNVNLTLVFKVEPASAWNDLNEESIAVSGKSGEETHDFQRTNEFSNNELKIECHLEKPFEGESMTLKLSINDKNGKKIESEDIEVRWLEYTEGGKNFGRGVFFNGVYWAPVNCGSSIYEKGGLHYQWGRKDGHRPDQEPTILIGQKTDDPDPAIFYAIKKSPFNWRENPDYKLWNKGDEDNPVKTEHDPCPDGWRVPTKNEISSVLKDSYNITMNEDEIFVISKGEEQIGFMASTFREYSDGKLHRFENTKDGAYWSSSQAKENRFSLDLYRDNNKILSARIHTSIICYGSSVRCVAE